MHVNIQPLQQHFLSKVKGHVQGQRLKNEYGDDLITFQLSTDDQYGQLVTIFFFLIIIFFRIP